MEKEDIKITYQKGVLTFRGEKRQEKETKGENYHREERSYGTFTRSFQIPGEVEPEKITAVCKDGILRITLPKSEGTRTKEILVKVE